MVRTDIFPGKLPNTFSIVTEIPLSKFLNHFMYGFSFLSFVAENNLSSNTIVE